MKQKFLKAVTIQGFKSFADRLRIDLEEGLSVVVGPNGCGKSNIADAIRWVMGEQSAKSLRGGRMEDVIFAGSGARKPVGMAEVSLHFDNSSGLFAVDYHEVTVTRRVYRDGDSEYLINKANCRLKDIQELFLDTGAGKEGFSIIGQGRVEEILTLRSEDRRVLIEEVAGISKFRLRRKEALKKLEDTEGNISRVEDILSEVTARLDPLALQAEVAAQCLDLQREIEEKQRALTCLSCRELEERWATVRGRKAQAERELAANAAALAQMQESVAASRVALDAKDEELRLNQEQVHGAEVGVQESEHTLSLLAEREQHLEEQRQRLEEELAQAARRSASRAERRTSTAERNRELLTLLAALRGEITELEAARDALSPGTGEELRSSLFDALSRQTTAQSAMAEAQSRLAIAEREKSLREEERTKRQDEDAVLTGELSEMNVRLETLDSEMRQLQASLRSGSEARDLARAEEKDVLAAVAKIEPEIGRLTARAQALSQLEKNLEGYYRGVKEAVLAVRQGEVSAEGFFGTVAENIRTDERYELALGTALGGAMQNIIVATAQRGRELIDYLRKGGKGRATFLPLDTVKVGEPPPVATLQSQRGFVGVAAELADYDDQVKQALLFLLGRVIIAEDMDAALEIARRSNWRYRIVTLGGDQVNVGGSLTGGSPDREAQRGLLGRRREIETLNTQAEKLNAQRRELRRRQDDLSAAIREGGAEKQRREAELQKTEREKELLLVEMKHREDRRGQLAEALKVVDYRCEEGKLARERERLALGQLEEEAEALATTVTTLRQKQEEAEAFERAAVQKAEALNEQITLKKVETARLEQEQEQNRVFLTEDAKVEREEEREVNAKKEEAATGKEQLASLREEAKQIEREREAKGERLAALRLQAVTHRAGREEAGKAHIGLEAAAGEAERKVKTGEQSVHQEELRLAKCETEREALAEQLTELVLTWEEALATEVSAKKDELKARLPELTAALAALGPVNMAALDEYPEQKERHEFLSGQLGDLRSASEALQELTAKLDAGMKERFAEGFAAVGSAFARVFRELFGGGDAELVLENPDDLLETGINIVARPPGKKARLLSLLSGGERAFTAIALLLALLEVKPTPFCLLDEIEAALDEANVRRFVRYIRKISDKTQFIVISHRRGTMEAADRLYGITMEEAGVSKMLTLPLPTQTGQLSESEGDIYGIL